MPHCPYLLYTVNTTCLTIISVCRPHLIRLFELPTALLEYLDFFYREIAVPLPSGLLHLYNCDYEIYNIAAQPGESIHIASKQLYHVPHLCIYRLKRRHFVTSIA